MSDPQEFAEWETAIEQAEKLIASYRVDVSAPRPADDDDIAAQVSGTLNRLMEVKEKSTQSVTLQDLWQKSFVDGKRGAELIKQFEDILGLLRGSPGSREPDH